MGQVLAANARQVLLVWVEPVASPVPTPPLVAAKNPASGNGTLPGSAIVTAESAAGVAGGASPNVLKSAAADAPDPFAAFSSYLQVTRTTRAQEAKRE